MRLAVYGSGGSGKEVYDIFVECPKEREKWEEIIFIDDTKPEGTFRDCSMMPFERLCEIYSVDEIQVVIAIGEPIHRKILCEKITEKGFKLGNVIHKDAKVSLFAKIGNGVVVQDGVIISSDAIVRDNVYINHRSMIGHDVQINRHSQVSAGVIISGGASVGEEVFIGGGCCVRDHISIGNRVILSMGSVALRDIPDDMTAMGNPARVIRGDVGNMVFK